jgi:predicted nucleic acid-binding protein
LVYKYSNDEPKKQAIAYDILNREECILSTQTLNEFSNICFKKKKYTAAMIKDYIAEILENCNYAVVSLNTIDHALILHEKFLYSYYDCLMLASAMECGCNSIYTEDMQDGQVIEGLTIHNIFD